MKIDLDHLHYWMSAIRVSKDPVRTLDAFWRGQIDSKLWLIEKLRPYVFKEFGIRKVTVDINGGWNGVLASLLFQSDIPVDKVRSIDIDPECEEIANTLNSIEERSGRFRAVTANMCNIKNNADIVINTVCEHLRQDQYDTWIQNVSENSVIVLQSNDYQFPEHVRIAQDLEDFKKQSNLNIMYMGEMETKIYKRFMIIGRK